MLRSLFGLFLVFASVLSAQITTGQIVGKILDSQGGTIASAQVTAKDEQTGGTFAAQSRELGDFTLNALPVGHYSVTVECAGFKQFVRKGIELTSNQVARLDITLEVGTTREQITVTADLTSVDTSTSTLSSLVDNRRLVDMPLNGRNVLALAALSAGVTRVTLSTGADNSQQSINVNGNRAYSTNVLLDGASLSYGHRGTALMQPPPDAVQEVKVITSGVTAEFGHGSATISSVTRSGTNELHGSLWDYFRNNAFDARSFFSQNVPKLRYNQFGGTAGGPIRRNKAFFFGAFQGLESRSDVVQSSAFPPTSQERAGNFVGATGKAPVDPLTNQPFPGATIPQSRFDPVAVKLMARFPLPNQPGGRYLAQAAAPSSTRTALGRVDYDFTPADRTSVRYFFDSPSTKSPFAGSNFDGYTGSTSADRAQVATITHVHSFSPTLLASGRISFTRFNYSDANDDHQTLADFGSQFITGGGPGGLPSLAVSGRVTAAALKDGHRISDTYEGGGDLSWFRGNHEFKFGGQFQRNRFRLELSGRSYGEFTFDGSITGNALADFMIGRSSLLWQETFRNNDFHYWNPGYYIQDRWRASKRLTLTLGLRHEVFTPWRAYDGQFSSFVPGVASATFPTAPLGLIYQDEPAFPFQTRWLDFAPRVGFAYDVFENGKTSIRGGYGIGYDVMPAANVAQNSQPFAPDMKTSNVGPLSDPQRYVTVPFGKPLNRQNPAFTLPMTLSTSFVGQATGPYTQSLHLTLEHQLAQNVMVQASYVGTLGRNNIVCSQQNPAIYGPGATTGNTDARRIYAPKIGTINAYETGGSSDYHALQITVNKRFSRGISAGVAYAYAKAIDEAGTADSGTGWYAQNPADRRGSRGLGDYDIRHRLVGSWVWELPYRRDQKELLGKLFGGWQLSGIATLQDGMPFNVTSGRDASLTGVGYDRPNLLGNPALPADRPLATKLLQYFDATRFQMNGPGQYGSVGRNILVGPGLVGLDASLNKRVRLWSERSGLEIRWDVFNMINRANFGQPGGSLSATANLGKITTAGAGRIMQLALRFQF